MRYLKLKEYYAVYQYQACARKWRTTNEQKQQLIEGVSDLMVKVLNKNKASVVVIIDEVDSNNYGLGGESVHHLRQKN